MNIIPKTEERRKRLLLVIFLVFGVGSAVSLMLFAGRDYISLFYTPTKVVAAIAAGKMPADRQLQVGGMVVKDSVKRQEDGVTVRFIVADKEHSIAVQFKGTLPDMFKEDQAAVAEGRFGKDCVFIADNVLAKHDEKYMPPEVAAALQKKILKTVQPKILTECASPVAAASAALAPPQ